MRETRPPRLRGYRVEKKKNKNKRKRKRENHKEECNVLLVPRCHYNPIIVPYIHLDLVLTILTTTN